MSYRRSTPSRRAGQRGVGVALALRRRARRLRQLARTPPRSAVGVDGGARPLVPGRPRARRAPSWPPRSESADHRDARRHLRRPALTPRTARARRRRRSSRWRRRPAGGRSARSACPGTRASRPKVAVPVTFSRLSSRRVGLPMIFHWDGVLERHVRRDRHASARPVDELAVGEALPAGPDHGAVLRAAGSRGRPPSVAAAAASSISRAVAPAWRRRSHSLATLGCRR